MKRIKNLICLSALSFMLCTSSFVAYANPSDNGTTAMGTDSASSFETLLAGYEGTWWDLNSQRCYMNIVPYENQLVVTVHWGISGSEAMEWTMTGMYDETAARFQYNNCVSKIVYTDGNGNSGETIRYANGTGAIYIWSDGYLYWEDNMEQAGASCYFEKEKKPDWTGTYISSDDQTVIVSAADSTGVVLTYVGYSEEGWYTDTKVLAYRNNEKTQVSDPYYYNGMLMEEKVYTLTEAGINIQVLPSGSWADGFYYRQ